MEKTINKIITVVVLIILSFNTVYSQKFIIPDTNKIAKLCDNYSTENWYRLKKNECFSIYNIEEKLRWLFDLNIEYSFNEINTDIINGIKYIRYQQNFNNVPIVGGEILVREKQGKVYAINGKAVSVTINNVNNLVGTELALDKVMNTLNADEYLWEVTNLLGSNYSEPKGELLIKNINETDFLVYSFKIGVTKPEEKSLLIYIDAREGNVLQIENLMKSLNHNNQNCTHNIALSTCDCCNGRTNTVYNGDKSITTREVSFLGIPHTFELVDVCRGGGIQTAIRKKNGTLDDAEIPKDPNNNFVNHEDERFAATTHWGVEMAYDYFYDVFGRNGLKNEDHRITSVTRGEDAFNAFWDPVKEQLIFGNGANSLPYMTIDIIGHEYTHGLISYITKFETFEGICLEESFCDIFGTRLERLIHLNDNKAFDYVLADQVSPQRSMKKPKSFGHPDTYKGEYWDFTSSLPHKNAGVQNYWYYLMCEGGEEVNDNGLAYNVTGVDRSIATDIAYTNMITLPSSANYIDAAINSIWIAIDNYGPCSYTAIQTYKAWEAVGVSVDEIDFTNETFLADFPYCELINNQPLQPVRVLTVNGEADLNCGFFTNQNRSFTIFATDEIRMNDGFVSGGSFDALLLDCEDLPVSKISVNSWDIDSFKPEFYLENLQVKSDDDLNISLEFRNELTFDGISIYPNPVKNTLQIRGLNTIENVEYSILNQYGGVVIKGKLTTGTQNNKLNVNSLSSGVYFLMLSVDQNIGKQLRFVKE